MLRVFGRGDIVERAMKSGLEFLEPAGQGGESPFSLVPPARRQVEQSLSEAIALETLGDRLGGMVVGK
jgi:hypothetical protein